MRTPSESAMIGVLGGGMGPKATIDVMTKIACVAASLRNGRLAETAGGSRPPVPA
jgi:aspartate/glutamate racemase